MPIDIEIEMLTWIELLEMANKKGKEVVEQKVPKNLDVILRSVMYSTEQDILTLRLWREYEKRPMAN